MNGQPRATLFQVVYVGIIQQVVYVGQIQRAVKYYC